MRRTTTHDSTRPAGFDGPVTLVARGRDLRTDTDGRADVVDEARVEVEATPFMQGRLTRIELEPAAPGIDALVGASPYAGFRKAVEAVVPGERQSGSVRHQLLDDLPTALMLSGRVLRAVGLGVGERPAGRGLPVDICAGWSDGGTAVLGYTDLGPPLLVGPVAPEVEGDDALGWHAHDALPPHSTRRRRRLDVWQADGVGHVDCFFRDSHVDGDGVETVVHEYTVHGTFDPVSLVFTASDADFGALPYPECPGAVASAARLTGEETAGLRRRVLQTMVGPSTCTHLNDQLRSLEDVGVLLRALARGKEASPGG